MAEELVLARLSVDSEGVIQGIDEGNKAMKGGEVQLGKLGKSQLVVEKSSTSLVGAIFKLVVGISAVIKIMAFFNITLNTTKISVATTTISIGGLTAAIAGLTAATIIATVAIAAIVVVIGLIIAAIGALLALLGAFLVEMIRSTEIYRRVTEALKDWWFWLTKGEDTLDRMNRRLAGFATGPAGGALVKVRELTDRLGEFNRALEEIENSNTRLTSLGPLATQFVDAFHGVDEGLGAVAAAIRSDIGQINKDIDEQIRLLIKLGVSAEDIRKATGGVITGPGPKKKEEFGLTATPVGPSTTDPFGFAGLLSPQEMADMAAAATNAIATIQQAARDGIISWEDYAFGVGRVQEKLLEAGFTIEEVGGIFATVGAELESVVPDPSAWDLWKDSLVDAMDTAKLKVELVTAAMNAFTNAMVQGFTNGGVSFKKIIGEMLMALVPILLAFGATGLVEGMLGINPGGFQAAAIAFAAAGAAALAARALGAGGGVATSAGGGGRGGGGGGRRQVTQEVNLYINGSLITDPAEFARWVGKILREADLDGAV